MRIYRENVAKGVGVLCVFLFLILMISYIDTQVGATWNNATTDDINDDRCMWTRLTFDERAERVEIEIEHFTDHRFEVWLVDSEVWNRSQIHTGPVDWLGHGIAGDGVIKWSVPVESFEGNLLLVRETKSWGQIGNLPGNATEARYDWQMTRSSIINPMDSDITWALVLFLGLAVILLAWAWYLPREEIADFNDLYPDFPESLRTREGEDS